jgi:hypothetical protein
MNSSSDPGALGVGRGVTDYTMAEGGHVGVLS